MGKQVERAAKLPSFVGARFSPHGTDSVGVVVDTSREAITYRFEHDPNVAYMIRPGQFTERFGRPVKGGKR